MNNHISVSQVSKYLMCPLAYRFQYIDRIETGVKASGLAFGTAFHCAADLLHRDMMNGGVRKPGVYHEALAESLKIECGNFDVQMKNNETQDSLIAEGGRLVDAYREYRTSHAAKLLATEQRVERELVNPVTGELLGLPFVAFVDLIEQNGRGVIVVDLKTAGRAYSQSDADLSLQLTCYGLLVLLESGTPPTGMRIDAVIRNKTPRVQSVQTTRTINDFARFWQIAQAVLAAIRAGSFFPNPGWQCSNCEYGDLCQSWGTDGCRGPQQPRRKEAK